MTKQEIDAAIERYVQSCEPVLDDFNDQEWPTWGDVLHVMIECFRTGKLRLPRGIDEQRFRMPFLSLRSSFRHLYDDAGEPKDVVWLEGEQGSALSKGVRGNPVLEALFLCAAGHRSV